MAQKPATADKKDKGKGKSSSAKAALSADLHLVRNAALTFAIILILTGGLIYFTDEFMNQKHAQLDAAIQQREEARQKLARAREEEQEIRDYLTLYQKLVEARIIGEEDRLTRIEALQNAQKRNKLAVINYDIPPQQTVQLDPSIKSADMELRATSTTLKLDLLHEGDLLTLLSALRESAGNFFSTKNCLLTRRQLNATAGMPNAALENRLSAECTVYWLTIAPRAKPPEEGVEGESTPPAPPQ